MKKKLFITLMLSVVLILVVAMSGCAGSGDSSNTSSVKKHKTLTILTYADWNPFEYIKDGKIVGFDIDLIKATAKQAGYNYQLKNTGWDAMFSQLQNKTADLGIAGITITSDREKTYDFSIPYFVSRQSIVVPKDSSIKSGADLKGKTVAVQNGSTGQAAVEKILGKNNKNIKKIQNGLTYMIVMHKNADAVVGDDTSNQKFIQNNKDSGMKIIQDTKAFAPEYFGIMFPKGSKYKTDFDAALKKLISDGTYSKLYKKWFKVAPDLKALKANP